MSDLVTLNRPLTTCSTCSLKHPFTPFFLQRVTNLLMINVTATFRKKEHVFITAGITVKLEIKLGCGYYFVTTMRLFVRLCVSVATHWQLGGGGFLMPL